MSAARPFQAERQGKNTEFSDNARKKKTNLAEIFIYENSWLIDGNSCY
jgi:hypothetical protein